MSAPTYCSHPEQPKPCPICADDAIYVARLDRLEDDAISKLAEALNYAFVRFDGDGVRAFEWLSQQLQTFASSKNIHRPVTPRAKRVIPPALRWDVFKRDDFRCKHCGTRDNLSADHIHPESAGGELELDNLQTLCRSCNSRKGNRF